MIEQILRKIPERKRKKMNYVHLGGIQILVESTFKEGINSPIVINLSNERFINVREGNLGIIEGNLAYTKSFYLRATANHVKGTRLDGLPIYEGSPYIYKTFEGNNFSCINMVDLPIQLNTIRIIVPCYITNHESDHNLILGNLFLNSLNDYSIGKNEIEISYKNETCFLPII
ncbi:hypothetical protein H5410_027335 [Solanum commersonii]|uniref:Uncharacterized protein n=1 Tax=Solanum commersonii TaxID=4109 RepID=A0A9J5YYT9_SOLCO|nr:hypothetical protein H5410_027335 [Solanum commersonii]